MFSFYRNVETEDGSISEGVLPGDVTKVARDLYERTGQTIVMKTILMNGSEIAYQDGSPVEDTIVLIKKVENQSAEMDQYELICADSFEWIDKKVASFGGRILRFEDRGGGDQTFMFTVPKSRAEEMERWYKGTGFGGLTKIGSIGETRMQMILTETAESKYDYILLKDGENIEEEEGLTRQIARDRADKFFFSDGRPKEYLIQFHTAVDMDDRDNVDDVYDFLYLTEAGVVVSYGSLEYAEAAVQELFNRTGTAFSLYAEMFGYDNDLTKVTHARIVEPRVREVLVNSK
jgi:hypothetical protein